jgi:murein DD-endopeptidase MepM/ murein hydrolase activator NlpD
MRTVLLMFIISASIVARSFQTIHINNTNSHKVKCGETAVQIAKKYGVTILELKSFNPNVNLSHLSIGTTILTGKSKQPEAHLPSILKKSNKNIVTLNKRDIASVTIVLPKVPLAEYGALLHLEHVLPVELTQPHLLLAKHANTDIVTYSSPSTHSSLANTRKILTNKKSNESDEFLSSTPTASRYTKFNTNNQSKLDLFWPVETRTISSTWGPRVRTKVVKVRVNSRSKRHKHIVKQFIGNHKGVDLNAPQGGNVFAAMDGQIIASNSNKYYGNFITIDHGNGVTTLYGHCDRNFVVAGETVYRGQKIAEVGCTGNATGPHVHFELRLDGTAHNPLPFMNNTEGTVTSMLAKNKSSTPISQSKY